MAKATDCHGHHIEFIEHFKDLADPRQIKKSLYPLEEILFLVLCAVLSGADDWVAITLFGKKKVGFLRRFLPFDNGTPSHDQLGNIFAAIDEKQFRQCFINWVTGLRQAIKGAVAIDGKTLRRSFDKAGGKGAIHMVSAWCTEQNLCLDRPVWTGNPMRSRPSQSFSICLRSKGPSSPLTPWTVSAISPG